MNIEYTDRRIADNFGCLKKDYDRAIAELNCATVRGIQYGQDAIASIRVELYLAVAHPLELVLAIAPLRSHISNNLHLWLD
jgi:hypothetical protein